MGVPIHGFTQLSPRSHPFGSSVPVTITASLSLLGSDRQVYTTASIKPAGPCHPTSAMAGPIFSYLRNSHLTFPGGFYDFHQRFHAGVVCPYWGFPKFRVPGPAWTANSILIVSNSKLLFLPYIIGFQCSRAAYS